MRRFAKIFDEDKRSLNAVFHFPTLLSIFKNNLPSSGGLLIHSYKKIYPKNINLQIQRSFNG
jgi:hypothetical protein